MSFPQPKTDIGYVIFDSSCVSTDRPYHYDIDVPGAGLAITRFAHHLLMCVKNLTKIGYFAGNAQIENVADELLVLGHPVCEAKDDSVEQYTATLGSTLTGQLIEKTRPGGIIMVPSSPSSLDASQSTSLKLLCNFGGWLVFRRKIPADLYNGQLWIIIPVHNRAHLTSKCLKMISAQSIAAKLRVLVVDDGSTDTTRDVIAEFADLAERLEGDGNLWWTGSVEMAIESTKDRIKEDDHIVLIGNDVILEANTLEILLEKCLMDRNISWAPIGYSKNEPVAFSEAGHCLYHSNLLVKELMSRPGPILADAHFGRCTIMSSHIIDKVGNFDGKTFPQYWGDTDFFLRAKRAGIITLVAQDVCVFLHHDADSTGIHHDFFEKPQTLGGILEVLFKKNSYYNPIYKSRFSIRHYRFSIFFLSLYEIIKIILQHRVFSLAKRNKK